MVKGCNIGFLLATRSNKVRFNDLRKKNKQKILRLNVLRVK